MLFLKNNEWPKLTIQTVTHIVMKHNYGAERIAVCYILQPI